VKYFAWDDAKNAKLRTDRGIGFEDIVFDIERGDLLDILKHPSLGRCGQRIFVVRREDYVYLVPFVEDAHTVFLKTIIRAQISRRSRRPGLEASLLFEQMSTCAPAVQVQPQTVDAYKPSRRRKGAPVARRGDRVVHAASGCE
jgi:hypothetical protein